MSQTDVKNTLFIRVGLLLVLLSNTVTKYLIFIIRIIYYFCEKVFIMKQLNEVKQNRFLGKEDVGRNDEGFVNSLPSSLKMI